MLLSINLLLAFEADPCCAGRLIAGLQHAGPVSVRTADEPSTASSTAGCRRSRASRPRAIPATPRRRWPVVGSLLGARG